MIFFRHKGNFNFTERFLAKAQQLNFYRILDKYGKEGVRALSDATPRDTGQTANAWSYEIVRTRSGKYRLMWNNANVTPEGVKVAIVIQYGHANRAGEFVEGVDYINPAVKPIFDAIANVAWQEVTEI